MAKTKNKITKKDFVPTNNDLSYYPLLHLALESTKGEVVEMGMGHGSTPLLHDYCGERKRELFSFEHNQSWLNKFSELKSDTHTHTFVENWNIVKDTRLYPSVVFIDHAPGERRKEDIVNFKDIDGIVVIHDTEPAADYGYQMRQHFGKFKYVVEVKTEGAWASAMSNTVDVTKWKGKKYGKFIVS